VPLLIAGNGDRLLPAAAAHADIVGLMGLPGKAGVRRSFGERVPYPPVAGQRFTARAQPFDRS